MWKVRFPNQVPAVEGSIDHTPRGNALLGRLLGHPFHFSMPLKVIKVVVRSDITPKIPHFLAITIERLGEAINISLCPAHESLEILNPHQTAQKVVAKQTVLISFKHVPPAPIVDQC